MGMVNLMRPHNEVKLYPKGSAWDLTGSHVPVHLPQPYRGTLLIRRSAHLGPCSRTMPSALRWS